MSEIVLDFDRQKKLRAAWASIYFLAGINLAVGLLALVFMFEVLRKSSFDGYAAIIFGLLFLVLGFFVQRKSAVALYLAMAVLIVNILVNIFLAFQQDA